MSKTTNKPKPKLRITEYTVSVLTKENSTIRDYYEFDVYVRLVNPEEGLWAIYDRTNNRYSRSWKWHYERMPSHRTEAFKRNHSFTKKEAMIYAKIAAANMKLWNGKSAYDYLAAPTKAATTKKAGKKK